MNKNYERDSETNLIKNIEYRYSEDGSIDWRAMIPEEYLYPNKDFFNRKGQPIPESIEGLKDHELCIKIGGIRKLAKWRGYSKIDFTKIRAEDHIVSLKCTIDWIPNKEEPYAISYSDNANASLHNTNGFGKDFLETIASNRSFIRAVRNFLGIDIVGFDELNQSDNSNNEEVSMPVKSLIKFTNLSESNFDEFIDLLRDLYKKQLYKHSNTKNWKKWSDIPIIEIPKIKKAIKLNV